MHEAVGTLRVNQTAKLNVPNPNSTASSQSDRALERAGSVAMPTPLFPSQERTPDAAHPPIAPSLGTGQE